MSAEHPKHVLELQGRNALVTGGSGDIGAATALALARRGANIVVHYYKERQLAEKVSDSIEELGCSCTILQADLSNESEVRQLAHKSGPVDREYPRFCVSG